MDTIIELYKKLPKESFELLIHNLSVREYLKDIWKYYELTGNLEYLKEFDSIFEELFRFFFRPFEIVMFNERVIRNIIPIQEILSGKEIVGAYTDLMESIISHMKLTFQIFSQPVASQKSPMEEFLENWRDLLKKFEIGGGILLQDYPFALPENAKNYFLDCLSYWNDFVASYESYRKLIRNTYSRAVEKLLELSRSPGFGSLEKFMESFQDALSGEFDSLLRSEEYLELQGKLMNTLFDYIYCLRRFLELLIENNPASPFATVSQIDEAYKRILDLKRKVSELEKRIEKLEVETCSRKSEK